MCKKISPRTTQTELITVHSIISQDVVLLEGWCAAAAQTAQFVNL